MIDRVGRKMPEVKESLIQMEVDQIQKSEAFQQKIEKAVSGRVK